MASKKPHAVCIPAPSLGHIKAVLKLAKLLHHKGFHITFVNTESFHKRYLKSLGPNSLDGLPDFQFETIPDGLPDSDADPMSLLCENKHMKTLLPPFRGLLTKLNNDFTNPPVTCIVSDGFLWMFTIAAAQEIGVPIVLFETIAATTFMAFKQFRTLVQKGLVPLKDEGCFTNGFLDKVIDMVPGMKDIRLKDLPTFIRTTDPNDTMLNFFMETVDNVHKASAVVFPTFDALEQVVLDAFSSMFDQSLIYAIGPMQLLLNQMPNDPLKHIECSLWKEESECLQWLNSKVPNSVVYVNFGSVAFLTPKQLVEFGWGLANSKLPFMWVIRPGLVMGESATLPPEFVAETKERGLIVSWCPQEEVLNHPSVGGFLTHCGWHSTMESLTAGVPMICWPFFTDQQTNCYKICKEWGIGMEIGSDVKRDEVQKLVKEIMEGEKGKTMRKNILEWKKLAEEATAPHGSSFENLDILVNQVLLRKREGRAGV
ncbi:putative cyanohydrin beta-glucosyltransferase [Rosa chinensis]|uniref:Glycosyltransferase n=1 Tax=Rosa chinensis TaxID=74649 RepID=A0A2P6PAD9_ROSCH|nr:(R)-mandelonitrile beta-glucosyltransferase [Rosa chinensis]PRQ18896.1 putative cyanohydrin beta-glucosyltransferase [Rosa chinensis]